jgi:glycosyltransferase involved in cell wall biosynthesis
MSIKYCILAGIYPPDIGGPAKFALTFSEFLAKRNFDVKVISYTDIKSHSVVKDRLTISLVSRRLPLILRYFRTMALIFKSVSRKELIIANGCFVEIAILRLFIPFPYVTKIPGDIVWERARNRNLTNSSIDEFQQQGLNWKYKIFRELFIYSLRKSNKVIVPSSHLRELARSWGIPGEQIALIHNSIDCLTFIPSQNSSPRFDVVTVSRLVPWKGLEEVIQVCSKLNISLAIVGDGPIKSKLEKFALNSKSPIAFLGELEQENLVSIYQESRFFILNSSFEATSYALLEAMSCGVVPISNDSTGSVEVIQHGVNGILCGPSTGLNLEAALSTLLDNPQANLGMSINARRRIQEDFNHEVSFEQIRLLSDV